MTPLARAAIACATLAAVAASACSKPLSNPVDAPAAGLYNLCYVNGFQIQPDEEQLWLTEHPDLILRDDASAPVPDPDWDEMLIDVGTADKRTQENRIFVKMGKSPGIAYLPALGPKPEARLSLPGELRNRNRELDLLANDLANVLASVEIPVIIVDQFLQVRRFTLMAQLVSSLLPGDVGRRLEDVKLKIKIDDLASMIRETIQTITPKEWEVQAQDGRWFRLQIRPYRAANDRLDGAILSFIDVDVFS